MAAINIDYSSLPFSDLETNSRQRHDASDFEMQQMPASRCVCTLRAMPKLPLILAGLQATSLHWLALMTTKKTPL